MRCWDRGLPLPPVLTASIPEDTPSAMEGDQEEEDDDDYEEEDADDDEEESQPELRRRRWRRINTLI